MIARSTPLSSQPVERRHIADAAAELHFHAGRFDDALDRLGIHRLAGERAVEIDDMQIFESGALERRRLFGRIAMKHGRARHVALFEPHADAVFEVDRRKQNHGVHFRKFEISARPSFWLFSGWNCVPTILSRPTMAVTGPPYSARAITSPEFSALS